MNAQTPLPGERFYLLAQDLPWHVRDGCTCAHWIVGGAGSRRAGGHSAHRECCMGCCVGRPEFDHVLVVPSSPAGRIVISQPYASLQRHAAFASAFAGRYGLVHRVIGESPWHGTSAVLYAAQGADDARLDTVVCDLWVLWARRILAAGRRAS